MPPISSQTPSATQVPVPRRSLGTYLSRSCAARAQTRSMTRANAAYSAAHLSTPPRTVRTYRTRDRTILATPLASGLLTPPQTIRTYAGRTRRISQTPEVLEVIDLNSLEPHADVRLQPAEPAQDEGILTKVYTRLPFLIYRLIHYTFHR